MGIDEIEKWPIEWIELYIEAHEGDIGVEKAQIKAKQADIAYIKEGIKNREFQIKLAKFVIGMKQKDVKG